MARRLIFVLAVLLLQSCQTNTVYSEYQNLNNGSWNATDTLEFHFPEMDSTSTYNMFINVRNDNGFAFSNLFLITEFSGPTGETVKDTLEYEMAQPDGTWLGKGIGSIKESKLWFRENVVFPDSGVYHMKVSHAMRKNGQISGLQELKGITDVGVQIEQTQ